MYTYLLHNALVLLFFKLIPDLFLGDIDDFKHDLTFLC